MALRPSAIGRSSPGNLTGRPGLPDLLAKPLGEPAHRTAPPSLPVLTLRAGAVDESVGRES
ncbi:hypothetical protein [Streptomyces lutosisoli]|uniref:Uncharacterized protein n=1 Tax=Streptomyces lutosisoli TaxID=2665721 RepID=A0ABW2VD68_9ACTN